MGMYCTVLDEIVFVVLFFLSLQGRNWDNGITKKEEGCYVESLSATLACIYQRTSSSLSFTAAPSLSKCIIANHPARLHPPLPATGQS
ncbi:hypothetical protein F4781DRAFT_134667 [Annulohypoxylon bovei var. microspora]|nr:hypothetical protein F4781DRAFT_134667 [Annulohypoxylon bovei var. microspora]